MHVKSAWLVKHSAKMCIRDRFWGMYNVGLQTIPALHKLYGAEQLQQVIGSHWHYSVAVSYTHLD